MIVNNTLILGVLPNGATQALSLDSSRKLKVINPAPPSNITYDMIGYIWDEAATTFDGV